jgi:hypothetical protein
MQGAEIGRPMPPPPILFNLVVDILSRMLQKAASANLIGGLGCELVEGV